MPILELPRFFTTNTGRKKARQFQYLNCFDVTESIFYCLCSMLLIIMKYVIHYYGVQIFLTASLFAKAVLNIAFLGDYQV